MIKIVCFSRCRVQGIQLGGKSFGTRRRAKRKAAAFQHHLQHTQLAFPPFLCHIHDCMSKAWMVVHGRKGRR